MPRIVVVIVAVALVAAEPAAAADGLRFARDLDLRALAPGAAIGWVVVPHDGVPAGAPPAALTVTIGTGGAPPRPGRRYEIVVRGDDLRGVLTSDSTRLAGVVTLDDVVDGRLRSKPDTDAVATVERLDHRISRNDDLRLPLTILVVAATILAAILRPRLAPRLVLLALALNLWLSPALALAAALAAVALPLGPACLAVLAVYLAALGLDSETVALSPLGPSQVNRFYGVDNLVETFLLLPALLGAALLGRWLGVLTAGVAIVAVAGNRFGADGGGLLVLLAGYCVLGWRLSGRRLTWRSAAVLAAAVVGIGLALVGVDAITGGSSHVTNAIGDGPGALADDLGDRLRRSVERTWDAKGALVTVVVGLAVLGWAVTKRGDPVLDALLVSLAVSLVVNDTPSDVVAAGAACAVVLVRLPERSYARADVATGNRDEGGGRERRPRRVERADRQPAGAGEPPG